MPDVDLESLFESWLADHGGAVARVARAYTTTPEDARDLVQEILLQVWCSLPRFQGRSDPATWCYRVALNTAMGWRRREHRRRTRQRPAIFLADWAASEPDSHENAAQTEAVERLYAAIRRLPSVDAALTLLYLDDLSYRQMAEVLGITESNVGVKLHRIRQTLSELLNENPHDR